MICQLIPKFHLYSIANLAIRHISLRKVIDVSVCPVEGCSGRTSEMDESNLCDGACKKQLEEGKYITTNCCQAKICFSCFETIFGRKHSSSNDFDLLQVVYFEEFKQNINQSKVCKFFRTNLLIHSYFSMRSL